ncbi:hypothetical protein FACS189454_06660 [Planctomycetales bacterium]|nr:hypothetical protein FACS189454_06660 [Planctomycetales bacterium]
MLRGRLESAKWFPEQDEETVVIKIQRGKIFRFVVDKNGKVDWLPILIAGKLNFETGKSYTFTIRARADQNRTISVGITRDEIDWKNLGFSAKLNLTTDWQTFSFTFSPKISSKKGRFDIGTFKPGVYEFQDSSLKPVVADAE